MIPNRSDHQVVLSIISVKYTIIFKGLMPLLILYLLIVKTKKDLILPVNSCKTLVSKIKAQRQGAGTDSWHKEKHNQAVLWNRTCMTFLGETNLVIFKKALGLLSLTRIRFTDFIVVHKELNRNGRKIILLSI